MEPLKRQITFVDFLIFYKGDTFCEFYCFPALQALKGSSLKGNNLLLRGANSFLLDKTPFPEGMQNNFDKDDLLKSVSFSLKFQGPVVQSIVSLTSL